MKKYSNIYAFTVMEIMIAIFIFTMWMASIFMVLSSSININNLNKNQIIASNLAREQIDIIRNIRDSNYKTYHKYNWFPNEDNNYEEDNFFDIGHYYKLENNFEERLADTDFSFNVEIINDIEFSEELNFDSSKKDFKDWKYNDFKLFLDSENHYTYEETWTGTLFYRYLYIDELEKSDETVIEDALKVISKVAWYSNWYHEFEMTTILTDFNRL